MVRFIRVRGRIIPIIKDAVAKGRGYFGREGNRKLIADRIDALKAVRETLKGKAKRLDFGMEVGDVYGVNNKVVKAIENKRIKDRFLIETSLNRVGHAPKTFLIKTKKENYIVQDKITTMKDSVRWDMTKNEKKKMSTGYFGRISNKKLGKAQDKISKLEKEAKENLGINLSDMHFKNWGFKKNKVQVIDAGSSRFNDPQGYWSKDFARRNALLRARKFIIGERKPRTKLTDDEYNALKAIDKFNLLKGKK
jgi:hypothetical protein